MDDLFDHFLDYVLPILLAPFFLTGEVVRKLASGGQRRIRWWDREDALSSFLSTGIGLGLWGAVTWLVVAL